MANRKLDRRTQRTRQALMSAFIELVPTRGYETLTIGQISRKANVGRSTVYLHYSSKRKLLEESLQYPASGLAACVGADVTPQRLTSLLEHFREQRDLNRVFFEYPIRPLWVKSLADLIEPRLPRAARASGSQSLPRSLVALMVAEMQIALITHWLTGKVALKPEIVAVALIANTRATLLGIVAG